MNTAPPEDLGLTARVEWGEAGSATVLLAGELDAATAAVLAHAVDEVVAKGRGGVHFRLERLQFCDAAGIAEFIRARLALEAAGRAAVLDHVPARIARTLKLAEAEWLLE